MVNTRILTIALLYILMLGSGYVLSRMGCPYGILLLTIHKLMSLGALVYLGVALNRERVAGAVGAAMAGVSFLGTIATGGVLSIDKPAPAIVRTLHRVTPYLTIVASAATLWLVE